MNDYASIIEELNEERWRAYKDIGLSDNLTQAAYSDGERKAFEKAIKIVKEHINEK